MKKDARNERFNAEEAKGSLKMLAVQPLENNQSRSKLQLGFKKKCVLVGQGAVLTTLKNVLKLFYRTMEIVERISQTFKEN